jgi:hypothetical protein
VRFALAGLRIALADDGVDGQVLLTWTFLKGEAAMDPSLTPSQLPHENEMKLKKLSDVALDSHTSRCLLRSAILLSAFLAACPAHGADRCDELVAAASADDVKQIKEIVKEGTGVNCRDSQTAETALMAAAKSGRVGAVKLLLASGADPNIKNTRGKTALGIVQNFEKAFSKEPDFAELVKNQRQVIAILEPRTERGAASQPDATPLEVKPADPNVIARLKLDSARDAVMAGQYSNAMKYLTEVFSMKGLSERNRTRSMAITADLSMRRQDWTLAKRTAESVVNSSGADEEDQDFCKEVLKTLRQYHPELFQ